jgi:hypothetical protein
MTKQVVKIISDNPSSAQECLNNSNVFLSSVNAELRRGVLGINQNIVRGSYIYTPTTTRVGTVIDILTTSIVTSVNQSRILINLLISGDTQHNNTFFMERVVGQSVVDIGSGTQNQTRRYGFATAPYDQDTSSTPDQISFNFFDTPNQIAGTTIIYRIRFYNSTATGVNLFLNRSATDSDAGSMERTSSYMILTEIGI